MNDTTDTKVAKIQDKIDEGVLANIEVAPAMGGVALADIRQVMEIAKMMAVSNFAVPKHLQGQQGPCFAICMYALEWRMSPFAVANKSYVVNDRLAFESQLLHAVIEQRAPIQGRLRHEFAGEGPSRTCTVSAIPRGESVPLTWTSPPFDKIKIKNSPEWLNNPDKQLYYHTCRDFCRIYFPDVILGVYTDEELADSRDFETVAPPPALLERLPGRVEGDGFRPEATQEAEAELAALNRAEELKASRVTAKGGRRGRRGKGRPEPKSHQASTVARDGAKEAAKEAARLPTTAAEYSVYARDVASRENHPLNWFISDEQELLRERCAVDERTYKTLKAEMGKG